jgi:hypothetical protein
MQYSITLTFLFLPFFLSATAQFGDILIWNGDTLLMHANPLEQYLDEKGERSIGRQKLEGTCTACWRGYVASWTMRNDSLFLEKIKTNVCSDPVEIDLRGEFGKGPIFASWFTGKLAVPKGEMVEYVHMGYSSLYEGELILSLRKGKLFDQKIFQNHISVFTTDLDSLERFVLSHLNWDIIPNLRKDSIRLSIILVSSGERKPTIAKVSGVEDGRILAELRRILGLLPDWDVYYKWGEATSMGKAYRLVLSEKKRVIYGQ